MPSQGWAQLLNGGAPWQTTTGTNLTTATTATISPQAAGSVKPTRGDDPGAEGEVNLDEATGDVDQGAEQ